MWHQLRVAIHDVCPPFTGHHYRPALLVGGGGKYGHNGDYCESVTSLPAAKVALREAFAIAGEHVRLTLLAALCWSRTTEITDSLVDLLIALVPKINARAERRVEGELIKDLRRVHGKEGILFRIADASVADPEGTVRNVVFPVASEATLRDLVREARANEAAFKQRVRTVLASSYSSYYRQHVAQAVVRTGLPL